jgi:ABC-type multidrug transport system fused ATPase/permease subunit
LEEISEVRKRLTKTAAEIAFLPSIGKYVFESAIVLGSLIVGVIQFLLNDAVNAVAALSLFLAAGSRIAPALLRIQQSAIQIRGSIASAYPALKFNDDLNHNVLIGNSTEVSNFYHQGFKAEVNIEDVCFTYPDANRPALQSISVQIPEGKIVAVVGSSGAGKSTLADILLGILTPDSGSVLVSKLDPLMSIERWPGAISYVPQTISIVNGSIRDNIILGSPIVNVSDSQVNEAISKAQLSDFVFTPEKGLDFALTESGSNLSGGQKQRLGLARALLTQPRLLVLDEATSALDSQTENEITKSINGLKGNTTVVIIAHRLSTVRNADQIIYMSDGRIVAQGSFEEVRAKVPNFDLQANLMSM